MYLYLFFLNPQITVSVSASEIQYRQSLTLKLYTYCEFCIIMTFKTTKESV